MFLFIKKIICNFLNFHYEIENLKQDVQYLKSKISLSSQYPTVEEINNLLDYKWQYFKFVNVIPENNTINQVAINIIHKGLTVNFKEINSANHKLMLKVVDPLHNSSWETPWMDACNATSPHAMFPVNGTRCVYGTFSDNNKRICFISPNTESRAIFYILLGIPISLTNEISINHIELKPTNKFKKK
jgi:hypothetical protein